MKWIHIKHFIVYEWIVNQSQRLWNKYLQFIWNCNWQLNRYSPMVLLSTWWQRVQYYADSQWLFSVLRLVQLVLKYCILISVRCSSTSHFPVRRPVTNLRFTSLIFNFYTLTRIFFDFSFFFVWFLKPAKWLPQISTLASVTSGETLASKLAPIKKKIVTFLSLWPY